MTRKLSDYQTICDYIASMGEWDCTHADLMGKDTLFIEFRPTRTQFGDALLVDCFNETDGNFVALIGGQVLMEQLKEVEDNLPLRAVIQKHGRYYIFASPEEGPETHAEVEEGADLDEIPF